VRSGGPKQLKSKPYVATACHEKSLPAPKPPTSTYEGKLGPEPFDALACTERPDQPIPEHLMSDSERFER